MGPFLSIGVCDVVVDLCVEFAYMWVRGGRGAESVSSDKELLGDFSKVGYHFRDIT